MDPMAFLIRCNISMPEIPRLRPSFRMILVCPHWHVGCSCAEQEWCHENESAGMKRCSNRAVTKGALVALIDSPTRRKPLT